MDDVTGKEALWALMGKGNEAAARAIIAAAAQLDERYLGRVYAFWACAQARRLIAAGDLDGLLGLLREDEGLLMTRDMHGRTGAAQRGGSATGCSWTACACQGLPTLEAASP